MTDQTFHDNIVACSSPQALREEEIDAFFNDIDQDGDGWISAADVIAKLQLVHDELGPARKARDHHCHGTSRRFELARADEEDVEKKAGGKHSEYEPTPDFLDAILPGLVDGINRKQFASAVKSWNVPSQRQSPGNQSNSLGGAQSSKRTWHRTLRAHWSVEGPRMLFLFCVFCLGLAFSLWQGLYYCRHVKARAALGPGLVVAKFAAGALYPTLALMLLSMSRWLSTCLRRSYWISKFVDWDYHKSFHVLMACIGLFFATMHGVGHMTGSFLTGSKPSRQPALMNLVEGHKPWTYTTFLRALPGWSGMLALGLYWTMALLALPPVRRRCYEVFQATHLLMYPLLGLLCAHGTMKIIQSPMLAFWLVIPCCLIVPERLVRLIRGFTSLKATMEILDDDTVSLSIRHPKEEHWHYQAGQYIFLQVPKLSFWQWHPFTVSACAEDHFNLHIKTDGNWTSKLRNLPTDAEIRIGVDGPYGAPAQRFYDFDRNIIIGAGVGITPFSAIVTDLEQHLSKERDPWSHSRNSSRFSLSPVRSALAKQRSCPMLESFSLARDHKTGVNVGSLRSFDGARSRRRRVDFHWTVREERSLLWFSSLLNRAHDLAQLIPREDVELNINTHITAQCKNISTHVFRHLLDAYRTSSAPVSALTGLKTRSQFGRPNYTKILEDFYTSELDRKSENIKNDRRGKVGVFFCGNPSIGRILSDTCHELNVRARADHSKMEFVFLPEVFQ